MRAALIEPLKEVYGVSDKVLMMTLSQLLVGASGSRRHWFEVGGSMIAVCYSACKIDPRIASSANVTLVAQSALTIRCGPIR
jgi:hypothetical protein